MRELFALSAESGLPAESFPFSFLYPCIIAIVFVCCAYVCVCVFVCEVYGNNEPAEVLKRNAEHFLFLFC